MSLGVQSYLNLSVSATGTLLTFDPPVRSITLILGSVNPVYLLLNSTIAELTASTITSRCIKLLASTSYTFPEAGISEPAPYTNLTITGAGLTSTVTLIAVE